MKIFKYSAEDDLWFRLFLSLSLSDSLCHCLLSKSDVKNYFFVFQWFTYRYLLFKPNRYETSIDDYRFDYIKHITIYITNLIKIGKVRYKLSKVREKKSRDLGHIKCIKIDDNRVPSGWDKGNVEELFCLTI